MGLRPQAPTQGLCLVLLQVVVCVRLALGTSGALSVVYLACRLPAGDAATHRRHAFAGGGKENIREETFAKIV